ncbi:MAG: patatin, partial [Flexistipes sinusarabici]
VSDAADYQMKKLLGKSYIRLQIDLTIASDDMDNASNGNVENLKQEAEKLILKHEKDLNRLYKTL